MINKIVFIFLLSFLILRFENIMANDPYDNDLSGKNLICYTNSDSIDDWGLKFLADREVMLYSLDKFIYEIFQYKRTYRTNLRKIMIFKGNDIEFNINRKTLRFGNKNCKLDKNDPLLLLEKRIQELKEEKTKSNKI